MTMDNETMLQGILRSSQMGQTGIDAVYDTARQETLRLALNQQRTEYDAISDQATRLAQRKGYDLSFKEPITDKLAAWGSKAQLMMGDTDSKIAEMMILGNTRGLIEGLQNLRANRDGDTEVTRLAKKLVETERNNIRQMEPYL